MRRCELGPVRERMSLLRGQPLTQVGYAADMLTLTFGLEENEFCLHIQCSYRMATEEAILFDRIDYFEPSDALCAKWRAGGLDEPDFPEDWPDGERRLFEQVKQLNERLQGMNVADVQVSQLGDLTLRFTNGMTLLALLMCTDDAECWRFWSDAHWPDQHMIVCGDHVELSGPGEQYRLLCE